MPPASVQLLTLVLVLAFCLTIASTASWTVMADSPNLSVGQSAGSGVQDVQALAPPQVDAPVVTSSGAR